MQSEAPATVSRPTLLRAVRRHLVVVVVCLASGLTAGWLLASDQQATYTSTARVLVNPTVGNPFAPAPTSVRQDELTSLETEAQVARSEEVVTVVTDQFPSLTQGEIERGLEITVPANTQILEMTYVADDPSVARQVADALASAYLANRDRRAVELNKVRIDRVETQTLSVVEDLRAATVAAQKGIRRPTPVPVGDGHRPAQRAGQPPRAALLPGEQRGSRRRGDLPRVHGHDHQQPRPSRDPGRCSRSPDWRWACLIAVLVERLTGRVRSAHEVEAVGLPVLAAAPPRGWRPGVPRTSAAENVEATMRRLRAKILDLEDTPEIIAVAPAGTGKPDAAVSEAVAESFAKAGHRVVLVRTEGPPVTSSGLEVEERGLAEALLHERLSVLKMLQPSVEPLLCLLPWGFSHQSRELLTADRLRTVLNPLLEAGHLVVLQSPGIDSVEGEAVVGAADLGLVVVTAGRTRLRELEQISTRVSTHGAKLAALVVHARASTRRGRPAAFDLHPGHARDDADKRAVTRAPR